MVSLGSMCCYELIKPFPCRWWQPNQINFGKLFHFLSTKTKEKRQREREKMQNHRKFQHNPKMLGENEPIAQPFTLTRRQWCSNSNTVNVMHLSSSPPSKNVYSGNNGSFLVENANIRVEHRKDAIAAFRWGITLSQWLMEMFVIKMICHLGCKANLPSAYNTFRNRHTLSPVTHAFTASLITRTWCVRICARL